MGLWNIIQETEFLEGMMIPQMAIVLENLSVSSPLFKNKLGHKVSEFNVTWFSLQGKLVYDHLYSLCYQLLRNALLAFNNF